MGSNKPMTYHFFFYNSDSHFIMTSSLFWLLADMLKQTTILLSFRLYSSSFSTNSTSFSELSRSFLFPNTNSGIPIKLLFISSSWIWALARSMLPK